MQRLEILAIANLIALVVLPLRKSIWSCLRRKITCIRIYDWLKSEKKELEDPKENEYFVLCCKADKEFLKNITKEKFIPVHSMKELKKKLRKIIK